MTLTDWIISFGSVLIATILGVATYFIQKWIQSVDETLKEHSSDLKAVSKQIGSLESRQATQAENIAKTIRTELAAVRFPHSKIEEVREETKLISRFVQERILPQLNQQTENFGRVVVLEDQIKEQNTKLISMFNALKILVAQKQKDQK